MILGALPGFSQFKQVFFLCFSVVPFFRFTLKSNRNFLICSKRFLLVAWVLVKRILSEACASSVHVHNSYICTTEIDNLLSVTYGQKSQVVNFCLDEKAKGILGVRNQAEKDEVKSASMRTVSRNIFWVNVIDVRVQEDSSRVRIISSFGLFS